MFWDVWGICWLVWFIIGLKWLTEAWGWIQYYFRHVWKFSIFDKCFDLGPLIYVRIDNADLQHVSVDKMKL